MPNSKLANGFISFRFFKFERIIRPLCSVADHMLLAWKSMNPDHYMALLVSVVYISVTTLTDKENNPQEL